MAMKTFYIVPHSHLDREWYRTFQENRIKLVRFMDDLLETMEEDPTYTCYSLDAQTSFIDDYFSIKPENKERFKKLVQQGRLPIGPWYVQPDEHLPTAEGIIRNMLMSKEISDEYADYNRVGYVPDSFGQSSALPTLLKGFEVDSAVMYRGFAEDDAKFNDFLWEGADGSQIIANWMPVGYGNAMFLNEDNHNNMAVIEENIELLEKRSISENYLLMCGSDQSFIKKFLPATIRRLNQLYKEKGCDYEFILATPQQYMDAIANDREKMEVVHGELRKGKRSRTHNSIGATRLDIKYKNFEVETKYLKHLEPLSTLCEHYGMSKDRQLINRGWKYIVENHAHDSICCCCTDDIHDELMMRYMFADQSATYLINEKLEGLHERIRYNTALGRPILLFSSMVGEREQQIETTIYVKQRPFAIFDTQGMELAYDIVSEETFNLKDTKVSFTPIPDDFYDKIRIRILCSTSSYGYTCVYIKEGVHAGKQKESFVRENGLANNLMEVKVEVDGSWSFKDLETQRVYRNQHIFVDDGNAGDEYDYSPSFKDYAITSQHALKDINIIEDTPLQATIACRYVFDIPKDTNHEKRSEELVPFEIEVKASLQKNNKQIFFKTKVMNQANNHRLQVRFDAGEVLTHNFADVQLGEIERENVFTQTLESEQGWHERYYAVFNQHKYCGLRNEEGSGFLVLNKGLPQYEIYQEDTTKIGITLLSCVGAMGNTNLKYRPGRRSGSADMTPNSQMQGCYEWEYSFLPVVAKEDYLQVAESYVNPILGVSYPEYTNEGYLPDSLDIIRSDSGVFVTTFKSCEQASGHVLRILNPYQTAKKDLNIQINRYLYDAIQVINLAENDIVDERVKILKLNNPDGSAMAVMSGCIHIAEMRQHELLTFRLT